MKILKLTEDVYKSKLLKQFMIDVLNTMFFGSTISWDGNDQFNQLPILKCDDEGGKHRTEQRGALLVHNRHPQALRLLVTASTGSKHQICYRLKEIEGPIELDDPRKLCTPHKSKIDFSLADVDLGFETDSSYSFSDNTSRNGLILITRLVMLLQFLLDSCVIVHDDQSIFSDLLIDVISYPPVPGDVHYKPIFEIHTE